MKNLREKITILENSPVGDSQANGAAERAVQAVGEQVRVLRLSNYELVDGFQDIEPAADMVSKFLVGDNGRTAYERAKGKRHDKPAEFGELVHYLFDRRETHENKLDPKWSEGVFLGMRWRTGEFIIGTPVGYSSLGQFAELELTVAGMDKLYKQSVAGRGGGNLRRLCSETMIASEC